MKFRCSLSELHLSGQPGHDAGHKVNQNHRTHHEEEHGHRHAGDIGQLLARHALQHKQVEAHRWRNLRHLDYKDDEDTKPDWVNARFLNRWHEHAHGQYHHGDAV